MVKAGRKYKASALHCSTGTRHVTREIIITKNETTLSMTYCYELPPNDAQREAKRDR